MPSNQSEKKQLEPCCGVTTYEEHLLKSMGAWRKDRKKNWDFNTLPVFPPLLSYSLYCGTQYGTFQLILFRVFENKKLKPSNHAKPSPSSGTRLNFLHFPPCFGIFLELDVIFRWFPPFSLCYICSPELVSLTQTLDVLLSLMLNSLHE